MAKQENKPPALRRPQSGNMGRPIELTPERVEKAFDQYKDEMVAEQSGRRPTMEDFAQAAGFAIYTIRDHLADSTSPTYRHLHRVRAWVESEAAQALYCQETHRGAAFHLRSLDPDRWGEKVQVTHSGGLASMLSVVAVPAALPTIRAECEALPEAAQVPELDNESFLSPPNPEQVESPGESEAKP